MWIMPKVLVVDDEHAIAQHTAEFFRLEGWTAQAAFSGDEALKVIDTSFDAIVLDLKMDPGIRGEEVLRRIRERPDLNGVCVVVVTGHGEMQSAIQCLRQGAFQ